MVNYTGIVNRKYISTKPHYHRANHFYEKNEIIINRLWNGHVHLHTNDKADSLPDLP